MFFPIIFPNFLAWKFWFLYTSICMTSFERICDEWWEICVFNLRYLNEKNGEHIFEIFPVSSIFFKSNTKNPNVALIVLPFNVGRLSVVCQGLEINRRNLKFADLWMVYSVKLSQKLRFIWWKLSYTFVSRWLFSFLLDMIFWFSRIIVFLLQKQRNCYWYFFDTFSFILRIIELYCFD